MKHLLACAAVCGLAAGPALADAEVGAELAEMWCIGCHDIEPGGANKTYPPSFASIAWFREGTQIRARILYPPVHAAMPNMMAVLSPEQVVDLVDYIQSLE